jgi:hypothetical protein
MDDLLTIARDETKAAPEQTRQLPGIAIWRANRAEAYDRHLARAAGDGKRGILPGAQCGLNEGGLGAALVFSS